MGGGRGAAARAQAARAPREGVPIEGGAGGHVLHRVRAQRGDRDARARHVGGGTSAGMRRAELEAGKRFELETGVKRVYINHRSVTRLRDLKYRRITRTKARSMEELREFIAAAEAEVILQFNGSALSI